MADNYKYLTSTEKAYWDIYTRLRALSDWDGFTADQDSVRAASRNWLTEQRKYIWRCAEGKVSGVEAGWGINQRSQRYEQLKDDNLNVGSCQRLCQLPTNAGTPGEKCMVSEREMWWRVSSVDDATKRWRQTNADVLTSTRKSLWHLAEQEGWDENAREQRYDNLCVATKTGRPYDEWAADHNTTTGEPDVSPSESSREWVVAHARSFLGVSENPPESNRGSPQPDGWENRVMGFSGQPWCACFVTCMAWDAGSVGTSSAGVSQCIALAKAGDGIYRGWTTDPSQVLRGDFAVIGCSTCHIGMVADSDDPWHTIEGNTSPGSEGSQYNGGCVAEKHRPHSDIIGWCLVDYP